jgi:hypothetical protein
MWQYKIGQNLFRSSLLIILLEVWSMARKYAFNPPKVRFHLIFFYQFCPLLIILLEVWSVARKYAFNPPKVRFHLIFFYQFCPSTKLHNTAACYCTVSFSFPPADEPAVLSTTSLPTSLLHLEHRRQRRPPGIKALPPLERLRAPRLFSRHSS